MPEGDQEIVKVQEVSQVTREEILKDFIHAEQAVIMSVPAATNVAVPDQVCYPYQILKGGASPLGDDVP